MEARPAPSRRFTPTDAKFRKSSSAIERRPRETEPSWDCFYVKVLLRSNLDILQLLR